jgi:hypothetical protein
MRVAASGDPEYFHVIGKRWHLAWCNTRLHHINYHSAEKPHAELWQGQSECKDWRKAVLLDREFMAASVVY